ncbi:hypothetical protein [Micromonospora sp. NPDC093277]|uniref:hypothetical protein n=1 Tax=Micromonospora sp. NPDC093277 TaxID=3364291 RepID=UPI00380D786D
MVRTAARLAGWVWGILLTSAITVAAPAAAGPRHDAPARVTSRPASDAVANPSGAAPADRYYIVGREQDGQREYLFRIAAETLGDGNRFREIFALNQGRPQPDGGRLTDPTQLSPGWILRLPTDASGPGVHTGPLPEPSAGGRAGSAPAAAASPDPRPPAGAAPGYLMIAVAVVVLGLLAMTVRRYVPAGATLRVLRLARGPQARQADAQAPGPAAAAPEAPAGVDAPAGDDGTGGPEVTPDPSAIEEAVVPLPAVNRDGEPSVGRAAGPDTDRPASGSGDPGRPGPVADRPRGVRAGMTIRLKPEPPVPGEVLDFRMPEVTAGSGTPPGRWLDPDEPAPVGGIPILLGWQGRRRFWIDLAQVRDVLTITGSPDACRRQAIRLAWQVRGGRHGLTVVGDVLGPDALPGCRRLPAFPGPADAPAEPGILISGGLRGPDLMAARQLARRPDRPVVPVLIGAVIPARWSLAVSAQSDPIDGGNR